MINPYKLETTSTPVFVCPICRGTGQVPNGFYNQVSGLWTTNSTQPEKCRACNGKGYASGFGVSSVVISHKFSGE